jgi:hypothetical protein
MPPSESKADVSGRPEEHPAMSALCHEGTLAQIVSGLEVGDRFRPLPPIFY